jgi:hypothetical protein
MLVASHHSLGVATILHLDHSLDKAVVSRRNQIDEENCKLCLQTISRGRLWLEEMGQLTAKLQRVNGTKSSCLFSVVAVVGSRML